MARQWTLEMDTALTQFVNSFCRKLAVTPARLHPHEIRISSVELASEKFACLQGKFLTNQYMLRVAIQWF